MKRNLKNAMYAMGAPMVLPATTFSVSPNTPTVSNPAESALANSPSLQAPTSTPAQAPTPEASKIPWGVIALVGLAFLGGMALGKNR
jgi:hypothetical protein